MKRRFICIVLLIFTGSNLLMLSGCGSEDLKVSTVAENEEETVVASKTVDEAEDTEELDTETTETVTSQDIYVYICGAVSQEGVYKLEADSRIQDVLDMAGGYSEDAAHGYVNLAEKLTDGMRIYIPTVQEVNESGDTAGVWEQAQPENGDAGSDTGTGTGVLVNINTADVEQLKTLPGIGDSKARDIVSYRDTNGPFGDVGELKNVSGIGESTFAKLSPYITVK